jgi:ArsR family transcriptional regulator, arsenate/arsenite/antimonite-responsive transcriptional repressor
MPTPIATENTPRLFHALADPTRLRIAELLRHGERCVCDLTAALDAGQSRLSFHLRTMKEAGLIADRRAGRWIYYRLRPEALDVLRGALAAFVPHSPSEGRSGCCASSFTGTDHE